MSHEKKERNRLILQYLKDNPDMRLKEVGAIFGDITRQRVSKIRKDAHKE